MLSTSHRFLLQHLVLLIDSSRTPDRGINRVVARGQSRPLEQINFTYLNFAYPNT